MASLACWHSYSYSELVFGTTSNAASPGYNWVMSNVLPQQAGLYVNGVFYQYTTVKNEEDSFVVYVQNENAVDGGYIFREKDDWTGLEGNTINKLLPQNNIDISYWGAGSIETEGQGEVVDASVVYSYAYDPCFDPQSNPSCPGYKAEVPDIPNVEIVNPLDEDVVQNELDRKTNLNDEDEEERQRQLAQNDEEEEEEVDLETILGIVGRSLQGAEDTAKHNQISAVSFAQSYFVQLPSTEYRETQILDGGQMPKNRRGRRMEFTQQQLHIEMMKQQFERKGEK